MHDKNEIIHQLFLSNLSVHEQHLLRRPTT